MSTQSILGAVVILAVVGAIALAAVGKAAGATMAAGIATTALGVLCPSPVQREGEGR